MLLSMHVSRQLTARTSFEQNVGIELSNLNGATGPTANIGAYSNLRAFELPNTRRRGARRLSTSSAYPVYNALLDIVLAGWNDATTRPLLLRYEKFTMWICHSTLLTL